MLKQWVESLAENIQQHWLHFKIGVGIFAAGACIVIVAPGLSTIFYMFGVGLLVIGILFSLKGYLGILAFRLTQRPKLKVPDEFRDK